MSKIARMSYKMRDINDNLLQITGANMDTTSQLYSLIEQHNNDIEKSPYIECHNINDSLFIDLGHKDLIKQLIEEHNRNEQDRVLE